MDMMLPAAVQTSARQAALVWSPHPLLAAEGRVVAFDPPSGTESLHDYLVRLGVDLSGPVIVAVDRSVILREWLTRVRPKPGTLISVRAAVAGGDGSQVIAIVAMIALTIAAPYLAGMAYGLVGGTIVPYASVGIWAANTAVGMALTTGITVAGSLAVSALTPKPRVDLGRALSSAKDSPTYSLSGGSNQARPYEPLGLTLGRHRVFFDLASRPYGVYEGADQYLYQVFHVGLHGDNGPVRIEDLRIGTTPLTDYQGVRTEFSSDTMPSLMPYNVDTVAGAAVSVAGGTVQRTSSADTTRLEVDMQFVLFYSGNGGLESRTVAFRLEYRAVGAPAWLPMGYAGIPDFYTHYWSHGYVGSSDGRPSYFDGVPVINQDGQQVYEGVGDPIWIQTSYDASLDPAAHTDGVGGWKWRAYADKPASDPAPSSTKNVLSADLTYSGSSATPLRQTYGVDVARGVYEIRCSRVTADETDSRATSDINLVALKCYQSQPGDFLGQDFLAVKVKASGQLNGTLSTLSGIVSQPVAVNTYSSNPADLFLLFARGYRVAGHLLWGAGLADSDIDLPAIEAWRVWCVSKTLSCNMQVDSAKSVWDMLQAICRCGRASPSWATGKLGVLWDAAGMPVVALFGPSNIKRDSFEVVYGSEATADEITLSFVDAAADYKADTVRVAAPGVVSPLKPASIELWGCTDRDMAIRECRLQVAHQLYRTRQVSWMADMEGLVVTRGDVVALSHDLTQWGTSGRLIGGTTTVLYLDRAITLDAGGSWITVVNPEGTMRTARVQYAAGEVGVVTLLDALPSAPDDDNPVDWRWLADYQATPGKRVKITDVKPAGMHEVRITAMDDPDEYYAFEEGTYTPPAVRKWTSSNPTISGLQFDEELVRAGSGYAVALNVSWTETGYVSSRQLKYRLNADPWIDCGLVDGSSARLTVPDSGTVTVVVVGYDGLGQTSTDATSAGSHTLVGQDVPPPVVTGFGVAALADGTRSFTWTAAAVPPDVTYLEIRYAASSGTAWASMTPLGRVPFGSARAESCLPAAGTWTFESRMLDASGNYSSAGARVTVALGAAPTNDWSALTNTPGAGANLLPNTEFLAGSFAPAVIGWNPGGADPLSLRADDVYRPRGGQALQLHQPGRSGNAYNVGADVYLTGGYADYHVGIPVTAGQRYEFSGKLASHRCDSGLWMDFFDKDNVLVGGIGSGWVARKSGGTTWASNTSGSGWTSACIFGVAPANAAYASVYWRKSDTDVGQADSYAWLSQPYFGVASANQTDPSAYVPGASYSAVTAASALSGAATANALLADIAADGKLTPSEKHAAQKEWSEITGSYGGIDGQAAGWSIGWQRTAHTDQYNVLAAYLSPLLADPSATSDIVGSTWRGRWADYYSGRQVLLNQIAAVAATQANWAGVSGSGKPLDNAGKVLDLGTGGGAGQRQSNDAPGWYPMGTTQQFKWSSSIGLGIAEWGVLRTEQQYSDDSGGPATQTFKSSSGEWKRTGTRAGGWAAWTRRLDRELNASNVASFVVPGSFNTDQLAANAATDVYNLSCGAVELVPAGVEIHSVVLTTSAPTTVILTANILADICNYTAGVAFAVRYQGISPSGPVVSLGALKPDLPLQSGFSASIYDSLGVVNAYCSGSLDAAAWIYGRGVTIKKVITLPAFASVRVYIVGYGDTTSGQAAAHRTQVQSSNLTVEVVKR